MSADVRVGVVEEGSDDARLEELALLLREELLTLDVQSVEPYHEGAAPEGTRAASSRSQAFCPSRWRLACRRSERLSPWCEGGCAGPAVGGR